MRSTDAMIMRNVFLRAAPLVFLVVLTANADVRLPALFSDHMVLQQGMRVPIWGWADEGEVVTVKFRGQTAKAKTENGQWKVTLKNLKAGGPDTLLFEGRNRIELRDVLVGEVWVCSGQSNMEWSLERSHEPEAAVAAANHPQIRLFKVPKLKLSLPTNDVAAEWTACEPETAKNFSAVAYYFARDLQAARGVPVGLIGTYWGGSPAEAWMSADALARNASYRQDITEHYARIWNQHQQAMKKWEADGRQDKAPQVPSWKPSELYNGMIAPLVPYSIRGAIWYQGESNAGRAHQYRTLFPDMIANWRRDWGQGDFTFLAVQLAPFKAIQPEPGESDWAELREAQLLATKKLPRVGMAVITDVGEQKDIHPRKKEPVGARLALAARGIAYGEKIEFSGPVYRSMKVKGDTAVISFDHARGGLESREGALKGFSICGEDKKFVWATAEIQGDKVIVHSPQVSKPVAVRYGWADFPVVNLWNKEGLPASPFRTDVFPLTTAKK
jgi:sialate O-acetylesterase